MSIDSVNFSPKIDFYQSKINANENKTLETSKTNSSVNKDTLVLSEKAKELSAQLAGKSYQEEMNESEATRLKENE